MAPRSDPMDATSARRSRMSREQKGRLLDVLLGLGKKAVREFLKAHELPITGTKEQYRVLLAKELGKSRELCNAALRHIDLVGAWGKQHVFLLEGADGEAGQWRDPAWVSQHLGEKGVSHLLGAHFPLLEPTTLQVARLEVNPASVVATAVKGRRYTERAPTRDFAQRMDGSRISYKAYVERVTRAWVRFEWNLDSNAAMLQISQLPAKESYEQVRDEFYGLVNDWLGIRSFRALRLGSAISNLHTSAEELGDDAEIRFQMIDYKTITGRRLAAHSQSAQSSLLGDDIIDAAIRELRDNGVGYMANVWWLPAEGRPIQTPFHTFLIAESDRINITRSFDEAAVRHVLQRVRDFRAQAP